MHNIWKMPSYSSEPRYRVFVNGIGLLSFAKNIGKNFIRKFSQNFLVRLKHLLQMILKIHQKE